MQAEHHLGKAEPRVVDGDAVVAGEREFEPAAEAEAVDHRHGRHVQVVEPIDDRVRLRQAGLDIGRVGHVAEFADVGAGDEAVALGGADHQPLGLVALDRRRARR